MDKPHGPGATWILRTAAAARCARAPSEAGDRLGFWTTYFTPAYLYAQAKKRAQEAREREWQAAAEEAEREAQTRPPEQPGPVFGRPPD
jgi:hypothetical protein